MYEKFFVYIDDGTSVFRVAIAAISEESAKAQCAGNGEIVAVRNVTEDYPISLDKVRSALKTAGFGEPEMDFICRSLAEFEIAS